MNEEFLAVVRAMAKLGEASLRRTTPEHDKLPSTTKITSVTDSARVATQRLVDAATAKEKPPVEGLSMKAVNAAHAKQREGLGQLGD